MSKPLFLATTGAATGAGNENHNYYNNDWPHQASSPNNAVDSLENESLDHASILTLDMLRGMPIAVPPPPPNGGTTIDESNPFSSSSTHFSSETETASTVLWPCLFFSCESEFQTIKHQYNLFRGCEERLVLDFLKQKLKNQDIGENPPVAVLLGPDYSVASEQRAYYNPAPETLYPQSTLLHRLRQAKTISGFPEMADELRTIIALAELPPTKKQKVDNRNPASQPRMAHLDTVSNSSSIQAATPLPNTDRKDQVLYPNSHASPLSIFQDSKAFGIAANHEQYLETSACNAPSACATHTTTQGTEKSFKAIKRTSNPNTEEEPTKRTATMDAPKDCATTTIAATTASSVSASNPTTHVANNATHEGEPAGATASPSRSDCNEATAARKRQRTQDSVVSSPSRPDTLPATSFPVHNYEESTNATTPVAPTNSASAAKTAETTVRTMEESAEADKPIFKTTADLATATAPATTLIAETRVGTSKLVEQPVDVHDPMATTNMKGNSTNAIDSVSLQHGDSAAKTSETTVHAAGTNNVGSSIAVIAQNPFKCVTTTDVNDTTPSHHVPTAWVPESETAQLPVANAPTTKHAVTPATMFCGSPFNNGKSDQFVAIDDIPEGLVDETPSPSPRSPSASFDPCPLYYLTQPNAEENDDSLGNNDSHTQDPTLEEIGPSSSFFEQTATSTQPMQYFANNEEKMDRESNSRDDEQPNSQVEDVNTIEEVDEESEAQPEIRDEYVPLTQVFPFNDESGHSNDLVGVDITNNHGPSIAATDNNGAADGITNQATRRLLQESEVQAVNTGSVPLTQAFPVNDESVYSNDLAGVDITNNGSSVAATGIHGAADGITNQSARGPLQSSEVKAVNTDRADNSADGDDKDKLLSSSDPKIDLQTAAQGENIVSVTATEPATRGPNSVVRRVSTNEASSASKATTNSNSSNKSKSKIRHNAPTDSLAMEPQRSEQEQAEHSRFRDVKKLLQKGGYSFTKKFFYRPGVDPTKGGNELGWDYFDTEDAFRRFLCEHGVGDNCQWREKEKAIIHEWVRMAIIRSVDLNHTLPEHDGLGYYEAKELLKQLGFIFDDYSSTHSLTFWFCPEGKTTRRLDIDMFSSEGDLLRHLARCGLPSNCRLSNITDRQLLSLEVYISQISPPSETFRTPASKRYRPSESPLSESSHRRTRYRMVQAGSTLGDDASTNSKSTAQSRQSQTSKNTKKGTKRGRNGQSSNSKLVRKSRRLAEEESTEEIEECRQDARKSPTTSHSKEQDKDPTSLNPQSQQQTAKEDRPKPAILGSFIPNQSGKTEPGASDECPVLGPKETATPPLATNTSDPVQTHSEISEKCSDQFSASTVVSVESSTPQLDYKARLSKSLQSLALDKPISWPFYKKSTSDQITPFAEKIGQVLQFVQKALASEGSHGTIEGHPANLYVCGPPGVGKTTGIRSCCLRAIREYQGESKPKFCLINASHLRTSSDPLTQIKKQIQRDTGISGQLNRALKIDGDTTLLLVIDEIETLLTGNSKDPIPSSEHERALKTLLDYANNENIRLALIGISNSSGDSKFGRLQMMLECEVVTFGAYNHDDLSCILKGRMEENVMHEKAVEFIAKTVANSGGDARKALEFASKAVKFFYDSLPSEAASSYSPEPLVTLRHVLEIKNEQNKEYHATIEGLPDNGKAMLCVLSALSQNNVTHTTFTKLRRFTVQCIEEGGMGETGSEQDFKLLLETLENSGLVRLGDNTGRKKKASSANMGPLMELCRMPVCIGQQSSDIEKAVESVLGKDNFYRMLMTATKSNLREFHDE
ncbi:hypothetical protein ACA910_012061 [Epithemia clementina (nom. ined.)]